MATKAELMSALSGVWMIEETHWQRLCAMAAEGVTPKAASPSRTRAPRNVAVMRVSGVIEPKASWSMFGFATALDSFTAELEEHVRDSRIDAIVLDVDSPGGYHTGTPEAAEAVYQARGRKHIVAVANPMAASAAYWIASAADELIVTPSGEVGSIGVRASHVDASGFYDQMGVHVETLVYKHSPHKAEMDDTGPMSDEARDELQRVVDMAGDEFIGAVAKHRGMSRDDVVSNFGGGRMRMAKEAVKAGMADRTGSLNEVVAKLADGKMRRKRKAMASARRRRLQAM